MSNFNSNAPILVRCSNPQCGESIPTDSFPVVGKKRLSTCRKCHEDSIANKLSFTDARRRIDNDKKLRDIYDDFSHCRDIK